MRFFIAALAIVLLAASPAPQLTGTWQGTLNAPGIGKLPRVMRISKRGGVYDVKIYSTQESDVPIATRNVTVNGSTVTMKFDMNTDPWMDYHRIYRATLSKDGKSITGLWSGVDLGKLPMIYHRTGPVAIHAFAPVSDMYVTVAAGVRDEVLDWGGTGRPIVLLAGQGVTARGWRPILPDLIKKYHVYAITRRGFGNSTKPPATAANYDAARLGEDVLAVLDRLHIEKPILVGHSIAGEELSYIGTNAPNRAAALIYLDAAYDQAYNAGIPTPPPSTPPPGYPSPSPIDKAIDNNIGDFKSVIKLPILAFFAYPTDMKPQPGISQTDIDEWNTFTKKQIQAFKKGQPNAKVVVLPNADHFVYISNTAEVLHDIDAFIASLDR
ncbi:MAG TPA: alpha/beta hydrolase [Candidatus Aquilonibacter sp.]|nr:alpha/beta hydrolase [Candidatus Aquilonibacter sp.]